MSANPFAALLAGVPRLVFTNYGQPERFMKEDLVLAALAAAYPSDLAEAGKVLEGVTPGPWAVDALQLGTQGDITTADGEICVAQAQMRIPMASGKKDAERAANARFIAWCREGVPALLARIAAQEAQIKEAKDYAETCNRLMRKAQQDHEAAETALAAMTKERDYTDGTNEVLRGENQRLETALAASEARVAKLVEKLTALEKVASEVARRGAETGPQWTKLTIALLAARAAITEAGQ